MRSLLLSFVLVVATAVAAPLTELPPGIKASGVHAVGGLSAGAFVAVQYHVAFSADLVGATVIAGGPFYCALGEVGMAVSVCMQEPEAIDVSVLTAAAAACASEGNCDNTNSLKSSKVWLFSGYADTVVNPGVMKKAQSFYESFVPSDNINATYTVPAEHSWPTSNYGNSCGHLGEPYINNCAYDASYASMSHLFGPLNPPTTANASSLYSLSQGTYLPSPGSPADISLGPDAILYAPSACFTKECRLYIVLHGCEQTLSDVGLAFTQHTGVNEVAEANDIVVIYPQAVRSELIPENPEGCFDWWGYTNANYATQKGVQMATIKNMASALASGKY